MGICYNRQKSHSPFGKQIVSMYQELIVVFDSEILSLEINPKESCGSQEMSFMQICYHGIFFFRVKKWGKN